MKELEVFVDKFSASFQPKNTKETNQTKAMKAEHLQCTKQETESLDDDKKGSFYYVYFDKGRYWGRLTNVS